MVYRAFMPLQRAAHKRPEHAQSKLVQDALADQHVSED